MDTAEIPACIRCADCAVEPRAPEDSRCKRGAASVDPVTGAQRYVLCRTERRFEGENQCGPQGRFYRPKHKARTASAVRALFTEVPG